MSDSSGNRTRIPTILVCSRVLVSEALAKLLAHSRFHVIAQWTEGDVIGADPRPLDRAPDLVMLCAPPSESHIITTCIRSLRQRWPHAKIPLLLDYYVEGTIAGLLTAGAQSILTGEIRATTLVQALSILVDGDGNELVMPSEFVRELRSLPSVDRPRVVQPDAKPQLSQPEQAILQALAEGLSNKAISRRLGVSDVTIKVHIRSLLRKLAVKNRTEAAVWAVKQSPGLER